MTVEHKHCNPLAFIPKENDGWVRVSRFSLGRSDFNFDRFIYRVYGVVFEKDTAEFREAVERAVMWDALK